MPTPLRGFEKKLQARYACDPLTGALAPQSRNRFVEAFIVT
jgi:hypothetical protein